MDQAHAMQHEEEATERQQQIQSAFYRAVATLNVPRVERLLKAGANINATADWDYSGKKLGYSPLMFATVAFTSADGTDKLQEQTEAARLMDCLLAHGADPNIGDPSGNRPLHELAVHVDSLRLGETHEWVHKLLEHGADPRLRNKYGNTAGDLHMKCHHSIFGEELEETDDLKDALDAHCERLSLAERMPPAQVQNTPRRRARL